MSDPRRQLPIGMWMVVMFYGLAILGWLFAVWMRWTGVLHVEMSLVRAIVGVITVCAWVVVVICIFARFRWGWYFILADLAYSVIHDFVAIPLRIDTPYGSGFATYGGLFFHLIIAAYIFSERSFFSR